jgi:hypothetical protein
MKSKRIFSLRVKEEIFIRIMALAARERPAPSTSIILEKALNALEREIQKEKETL